MNCSACGEPAGWQDETCRSCGHLLAVLEGEPVEEAPSVNGQTSAVDAYVRRSEWARAADGFRLLAEPN